MFSFEFFPPKTPEGVDALFEAVAALKPLRAGLRLDHLRRRRRDPRRHGRDRHPDQTGARDRDDGPPQLRRRDPRRPAVAPRPLRRGRDRQRPRPARRPSAGRDGVRPPRWRPLERDRADRVHRRTVTTSRSAARAFRRCTPRRRSLDVDLDYLKTKVDAGAELPDHPAVLRQRRLLALRRRRPRARDRRADHPRGDPDRELRAGLRGSAASATPRSRRSSTRRCAALGGDEEAERLLGVAYAARQCDELLAGGAPGIHFYALNRASGARAVLSALRASRPWERVEAGQAAS